jgi:protein-S-isoprenylcysteine O-methyltransferase Ste14
MMPSPALVLCALCLGVIAALPRVFFRRGTLNVAWWLTALPFGLAGAGLLQAALAGSAAAGGVAAAGMPALAVLPVLAVLPCTAALLLVGLTLGTHREPLALWHQADDAPVRLVTHGAYARVRHPFYLAFQLTLAGCLLAAPGPLTATALLWGVARLNQTAAREERRLLESAFGAEYRAYMRVTGRFLPRWPAPGRAAPRPSASGAAATTASTPATPRAVRPGTVQLPSGSGLDRT